MKSININQLNELLTNQEVDEILDVRTLGEIQEGIIQGAKHFDVMKPDFKTLVDTLDKSKAYAVTCRSGARSMQAIMHMQSLGFEKLYNLEGGMMLWNGEKVMP